MDTKTLAMVHNPSALPTTLLLIVLDTFGVEAMDWLPSVMMEEMQSLAKANVPPRNFDKVNGLILALTTDRFYTDPKIMMKIANSLAPDGPVMFGSFDPPDTRELGWAVTELRLHEPGSDDVLKERYSDRVMTTMRLIMRDEGLVTPPAVLGFAGKPGQGGHIAASGPAMFDAVRQSKNNQADQIDRWVQARFRKLAVQLRQITLEDGDMAEVKEMVDKILTDR